MLSAKVWEVTYCNINEEKDKGKEEKKETNSIRKTETCWSIYNQDIC